MIVRQPLPDSCARAADSRLPREVSARKGVKAVQSCSPRGNRSPPGQVVVMAAPQQPTESSLQVSAMNEQNETDCP